jgi:MFS family permease
MLLRAGVFALLASTAVLISADSQGMLWVGMGIFGVGFGMINPGNVAALSIHAQGHGFGKIAGNNASASSFGFAIGPMLGSVLYQEIHPLAPFYVASCLVIIMLVLVYFVAKMPST